MPQHVFILGSGAFAQACGHALVESGSRVSFWSERGDEQYRLDGLGPCFSWRDHPNPLPLFMRGQPDLIIPSSLAWLDQPWANAVDIAALPILSPPGAGVDIERRRGPSADICRAHGVRVPRHFTAADRDEATAWVRARPGAYVVKNPNCSPGSPIQAIVCDNTEDTLAWLRRVDDSDGIFLQEHMGEVEAGHFVAVSGGEITSLVTNQEYKRAYTGNLGPLAQAPLAGIVERDPDDRYGLADALIHPLRPWLREVGFRGILQVTGMRRGGHWHAIEYNVRLGVTTGPLLLQMLAEPAAMLSDVANNRPVTPRWRAGHRFGGSLSLVGLGYPHAIAGLPELPITVDAPLESRIWWHQVRHDPATDRLYTDPSRDKPLRIADLNACGPRLDEVIASLYRDMDRLRCQGSHYRLDLGNSLWPPGAGHGRPRDLIASTDRLGAETGAHVAWRETDGHRPAALAPSVPRGFTFAHQDEPGMETRMQPD